MIPLVYALFTLCMIESSFASPYDYHGGQSSLDDIHTPPYTFGKSENSYADISLIGKLSSGIKLDSGSSLVHGSDAGYGNSDDVYSAKPLHSEDLSLPALDLTKHSAGDISLLQSLSHGSEVLSGFDSNSDSHGTLGSLTTLQQAPFHSLHNAKELSSTGSGDHINNLFLASSSAVSETVKDGQSLHNTLDSHTKLADDVSPVHLAENSHNTEEHSHLSSIIKAFAHGWSALFSH